MRVRLLSHPRPGGKVEVILVGAGSFGTVRLVGPGRVVKVIKTDMDQGIREIVAYKVFDTIDQSLAVTCYEARVFSCGAIELDLGQGVPLDKALHQALLTPRQTLRLAWDLVQAWISWTDAGLFHCDVKPANAIVLDMDTARPRLAVIDWGLARTQACHLMPLEPYLCYSEPFRHPGLQGTVKGCRASRWCPEPWETYDLWAVGVTIANMFSYATWAVDPDADTAPIPSLNLSSDDDDDDDDYDHGDEDNEHGERLWGLTQAVADIPDGNLAFLVRAIHCHHFTSRHQVVEWMTGIGLPVLVDPTKEVLVGTDEAGKGGGRHGAGAPVRPVDIAPSFTTRERVKVGMFVLDILRRLQAFPLLGAVMAVIESAGYTFLFDIMGSIAAVMDASAVTTIGMERLARAGDVDVDALVKAKARVVVATSKHWPRVLLGNPMFGVGQRTGWFAYNQGVVEIVTVAYTTLLSSEDPLTADRLYDTAVEVVKCPERFGVVADALGIDLCPEVWLDCVDPFVHLTPWAL